jgi:ribosomal protein L22
MVEENQPKPIERKIEEQTDIKEDVKTIEVLEEKKLEKPKQDKENKPEKVQKNSDENLKDSKTEKSKEEEKKETKKDEKKSEVSKGPKKKEAVINGRDLRISTKHAIAVCNFIRNKNVDRAIVELEQVGNMKKPIPMKGEIPHKKGIMSGRYPINAVKAFIRLLKSVKANAIVNELELEKVNIYCMANVASRPAKRFGQMKHKRSHVQIKLIPIGGKK